MKTFVILSLFFFCMNTNAGSFEGSLDEYANKEVQNSNIGQMLVSAKRYLCILDNADMTSRYGVSRLADKHIK